MMAVGPVRHEERGAVSVMMALLGIAILAAVGLVVDGGRQLGAITEARNMADNAARFGAQEVDIETWRTTGRPVIDRPAASSAIAGFLGGTGYGYTVPTPTGPDADVTVSVTVQITTNGYFFGDRQVQVTQSANAIDSVLTP